MAVPSTSEKLRWESNPRRVNHPETVSVVSTARKQGANILKTLADPPTQIALALNA
jgi:hypothetical protein